MTSTALAVPAQSKPKRVDIRGRLRAALDKMVWEGLPYDEAARECDFTVSAMRKALQRPHILAYLRNEREVLRASIAPRNIHRLVEIRDAADNMPAVQAIKALEQLGEEQGSRSPANGAPGVTIRIITVQANERQPVTIDADTALTLPNPAHESDRGEKL